ncbi:MAG: MFS transporter [Candidatus Binataceae bacterium]
MSSSNRIGAPPGATPPAASVSGGSQLAEDAASAPATPSDSGAPPSAPAPQRRRRFIESQFPPFTPRQWRVFWISTTAGFFDSYDGALLSLALRQIQRGLGVAEAHLGAMLSVIRLGYLGSLLIAPLADVFGRRRLLLYTIVGYTIFTGLSAVAPHDRGFVTTQFLARAFSGAEATVSLVILAEEVDAAVRGWALGLQGALAISGYGLAAMVFALVGVIPYGWRGLYALALLPLVLIMPLRRILPESKRFERESLAGFRPASAVEPVIALFRVYPKRLWIVVAVAFLNTMGAGSASFFFPTYLQEAHGWSPAQVSSLVVFGGALGILGSVVAGRLSDRFGRRMMGALFMFLGPLLTVWMYTTRTNAVIPLWMLRLFCDTASGAITTIYSAELFPTSHRAAAASAMVVSGTTGGALGLMLESVLYGAIGSHWTSICYLTVFWLIASFVMFALFPETAGRELDEISPESPAPW